MAEKNVSNRRRDISALFGTEDIPLDEEFFEEKIKEMGDGPAPSAVRRMKLKKPEEDATLMSEAPRQTRTVTDRRAQQLFGTDDMELSEEFFEEKLKELEEAEKSAPEKPKTEYDIWLEEGLKKDKGYGAKESYEGDVDPEEDSYKDSTYEKYDKWQAETQQLIRNLKARDARVEARDDNLHDILYLATLVKGGSGIEHTGNTQRFFGMIIGGVWFAISSLMVMGIFFGLGARGSDLLVPFGLGSLFGAIIRYNGRENYTFTEALQHGAVEVGVLASTVISWIISLIFGGNIILFTVIGGAGAIIGEYIKQRIFFERPTNESIYKTVPFALATIAVCSVIIVVELIIMMEKAG